VLHRWRLPAGIFFRFALAHHALHFFAFVGWHLAEGFIFFARAVTLFGVSLLHSVRRAKKSVFEAGVN